MNKLKVVVMVSGGGTDLQSIIDAIADGTLNNVEITNVISSKADAYALTRAANAGIPTTIFSTAEYNDIRDRMKALMAHLDGEHPDLIVLAGYLSILPQEVIEKYRNQIINIHPSLLPKFGGKDCYGIKVHEQVIAAGETESGATVHYVDEGESPGSGAQDPAQGHRHDREGKILKKLNAPGRQGAVRRASGRTGARPLQRAFSEGPAFVFIAGPAKRRGSAPRGAGKERQIWAEFSA